VKTQLKSMVKMLRDLFRHRTPYLPLIEKLNTNVREVIEMVTILAPRSLAFALYQWLGCFFNYEPSKKNVSCSCSCKINSLMFLLPASNCSICHWTECLVYLFF